MVIVEAEKRHLIRRAEAGEPVEIVVVDVTDDRHDAVRELRAQG